MPTVFAADPLLARLLALWPVWAPLLVGGVAIFWLLPRPRGYPAAWGAVAGLAAIVLGGMLLVRGGGLTPETVLFYAFSGIAVLAGGLLVTQRNPARAALSFALVVLSSCGLFLLLAAPFLMAATIIIYAGAIVVTFLFVLMLAQQEGLSDADARSREPLLATLTGFVLLGALLYVLTDDERRFGPRYDDVLARTDALRDGAEQVREWRLKDASPERDEKLNEYDKPFTEAAALLRAGGQEDLARAVEDASPTWSGLRDQELTIYREEAQKLRALVLEGRNRQRQGHRPQRADARPDAPLSPLSGTPPNTPTKELRRDPKTGLPAMPADNPAFLGRALFTDYVLPVELGGTLLLVATVGAIAIAQRRHGQAARPTAGSNGATPGRTA